MTPTGSSTARPMARWFRHNAPDHGLLETGAGGWSHCCRPRPEKWSHSFNQSGSTIYATNGNSSISAVTRIRTDGLDKNNLNFDVAKDATLTVSGRIRQMSDQQRKGRLRKRETAPWC